MKRKRGQPDRSRRKTKTKAKKRKRSLSGRLLRLVGGLIVRHPSLAGGTAVFLVVFGFVSTNAIWHQPGAIAHPLFSTRDRIAHMAKAVPAKGARSGLTIEQVIAGRRADPRPDATEQTASIPAKASRSAAASDPLIRQIQTELADRQFYLGPIDGADDHKTRAAIEAFQAATGRRLTGEPSAELLAEIQATHRDAVALPRSRPGDQPPANDEEVAKIIAASAPGPALSSVPTPTPRNQTSPQNLVARIQTGLRNIAYSNVAVDGIAGAQTKAAIRNFEKNYRLPQTGEPNRRVLDKLISIGAL